MGGNLNITCGCFPYGGAELLVLSASMSVLRWSSNPGSNWRCRMGTGWVHPTFDYMASPEILVGWGLVHQTRFMVMYGPVLGGGGEPQE